MAAASLFLSNIKDAFAHTGLYILLDDDGSLIHARDMSDTGTIPLGARPASMYPVGTDVLALRLNRRDAIIIGAVPSHVSDARIALPSSVTIRGKAGQWEDPAHYDPLKNDAAYASNYSSGRPVDILPGDWGRTNDLGLMILVGRMMALFRGSDNAQIQAFYGDDLLRLVGYNYERFTAGAEERCINDEGEYQEIYRSSPYPWEAMGKLTPGNATTDKDGVLEPGALYAPIEPKADDQQIAYRHMRLRGYLGDVEREYVCRPPDGDIVKYSDDDKMKYTGLLEILKQIDGSYSVRSAKQITFEKYVILPIPKEKVSAEDPKGDTSDNYKFAGQTGDGEDHELKEFEWSSETPYIRAAQLWDYHAYVFGKYAQMGLIRHTKDWSLPEEKDLSTLASKAVNDNISIGHKFYADLPDVANLVVDQRKNHTVKYYASRSIIKQMDDGGILLEDGYGSQIRMEGGNIFLSCVGDVWTMPGRNAVTWAPHDIIQKAGNSVDITAAKKDVRIKSEQNVHVLSGNGGDGSLLLECRATNDPERSEFDNKLGEDASGGGIFLKCKNSTITAWGKKVYVGGFENGASEVVIDAGDMGTAVVRGNTVTSVGIMAASMMAGGDQKKSRLVLTANTLIGDSDFNRLGGFLVVSGTDAGLLVDGPVLTTSALVVDGVIVSNTSIVCYQQDQVAKADRKTPIRPPPDSFDAVVNEAMTLPDGSLISVDGLLNGDSAPGKKELQTSVGFSCRRTVEDLKLEKDNFKLPFARWQAVLAAKGGETATWVEPAVKYPDSDGSTETYPHPGKEAWRDWDVLQKTQNSNFDMTTGLPVERSALSEKPKDLIPDVLYGNYVINVQS